MQDGLSLICATNNRDKELHRLLQSLAQQTNKNFEIIIVDQNQSDLATNVIGQFSDLLKIVHVPSVISSNTKARNLGVKYANYPWLAFPDDDCWYPPDLIEDLLKKMKEINADAFFINWTDPEQSGMPKVFSFTSGKMELIEAFTLASCICLFFKKNAFVEVNGFNEKLGLGTDTIIKAGEEQDLMLRLLKRGKEIYKLDNLTVFHRIGAPAWSGAFKKRVIGQGACDIYFKRKYIGWGNAFALLIQWTAGVVFNLLRFNKKNARWYYYKLVGGLYYSSKIE